MIFTRVESWEKLRLVRCGVSARFTDAKQTEPPNQARFVCVGRLCPEKAHHVLLEAVRKLKMEGQVLDLRLIGDGPSRADIEGFISTHNLDDCVNVMGWQSTETVMECIRQSRVFVLPSFAEGLPVAFMEALALGRPVIATRIAGIPELIEEGVNGWLVPPADADALTDALRDAAEAPVERIQRMGACGRATVLRDHNSEKEVSRLAEYFRQVIEGR